VASFEPRDFDTKFCRIGGCENELDSRAPTRGRHAGMCDQCRAGDGVPIRLHRERLERELKSGDVERAASGVRPANPRPAFRYRPATTALSAREREVLAFAAAGMTNTEIAAHLVVSTDTVKSHLKHVFWKLDARDRAHAVALAIRAGAIE
jgi:DNA-binding CsgD family transcriptional regulator